MSELPGTTEPNGSVEMPIVFDVDHTLLIEDSFELALMRLIRRQRKNFFALLPGLPRTGWAAFKTAVFSKANLQVDELLFDREVRARLETARDAGRAVWIATASPQEIADKVGAVLRLPAERCLGSSKENLKGKRKAAELVARFGAKGFDYVGDSRSDEAVWKVSRHAIAVARSSSSRTRFLKLDNLAELIDRTGGKSPAADWWKLIRPKQWAKNALILVPLLAGHQWGNPVAWTRGLWAMLVVSIAASAVYVVNDALDWAPDRRHPRKCKRPIAAGRISPMQALLGAGVLFAIALGLAASQSVTLVGCAVAYALLAMSYSLYIKQQLLIDTVVLAHFYIIRIVTGGLVMDIELSPWLVSFAGFMFFSAATVKRFCELKQAQVDGRTHNELRAYQSDDLPILAVLGVGSGLLACLVLSLYLSSDLVHSLYRRPTLLWFACPLFLYWIGRIWMLANRGVDIEDPFEFAMQDRVSYLILACVAVVAVAAI